jgi:hypothetical protein
MADLSALKDRTTASHRDGASSRSISGAVLKAVVSTFCGSEALGRARRLRCALRLISHPLANREATVWVKQFDYKVIRRLLGFYLITRSSTIPIV